MPLGGVLLSSILAGLVGSMTGMGGGIVLIPVLTWCGIEIRQAIALSTLSMLVIANTAAARYAQRHMPNFRIGAFLEFFAIIGALAGSLLAILLAQRWLLFFCGVMFFLCGGLLWRQRHEEWHPPTTQPDRLSGWLGFEGSYYDHAEGRTIHYQGRHALPAGLLMVGAGFVSGLLGLGGSGFAVLINSLVIGLPPKVSLTTSHLIISVMALASADVYLESGLIPLQSVAPMLLGVALGAYVGSGMVVHLKNRTIRNLFLGVLLILGVEMIARGLHR